MKFWDEAYTKALKKDLIKSNKFFSLEDIDTAYNKMLKRVKQKNNFLFIYILSFLKIIPDQNIHILDLNKIINQNGPKKDLSYRIYFFGY